MTGLELLQVASLVVGVGTPAVTLVYLAGAFGQRLKGLEAQHLACQGAREAEEDKLHGRVTAVKDDLARTDKELGYLKGRMNGHAQS